MTTKGMSPLRSLAQSSPRKPQHQDGSSNENAHDLGSGSALLVPFRAPLCPIPLPSQLAEGIGNGDTTLKGKPQLSTPRGKSKMQQRTDNSGATPDKHTATSTFAQPRNRFGWHQPRFQAITGMEKETSSLGSSLFSSPGKHGQESPHSNEGKDIRTPSRLLRSSSFSESSHSSDGVGASEGQLNSNCVQNLNRAGNSNQSTPRSTRSLKLSDSSNAGGSQLNGTPNRNVSRTLKYLANNPPSSSGALGTRLTLPGLRLTGPLSQQARSTQPHSSDYQSVDVPYFELEEDPSFWNDYNVQVLIRCRPLNSSEISSQGYSRCLRQETAHTVTWIGQPESRFTFDHVACEKITQEKLFKIAGIPMVDNCMSGYNSCMFAYGQTGSGKTHTMLGDIDELEQRPSDNRGMTPRIFEYLFGQISMEEELRKNEQLKFTCKCSFLEIYNEQITDLLEPSSTNLQMREDLKKGVYVENLSEVEVKSVQDVVFLLLQGAANRRVAATNMNQESSRSHSVFTCVIESKWESESMTNLRFGRLNLVDLAGSERQKSSGAEGERLKEAASINKSLSTLGLVIMILVDVAQGKQRHVPYRDSKLTFLLQDSLGGNSKTTIIANVSPSVSCTSETLSTLKFAQRAKFIRNNAIVNEDASGDVLALRLQIQQLKEELNRLSRQSISRIPLSSGVMPLELSTKEVCNGSSAVVGCLSKKGESFEPALEKVKALEAVVVGSLRREKAADNTAKRLTGEIEQLNCLVRQREDDAQFNKMMLRFREDKIRRLEASIGGALSEESCRSEEIHALKEELDLMRGRLDRNPELTRFAMENIRLREQFQRLQDFYGGGDREILLEEISGLRDQLSEYLEAKLTGDDNMLHQMSEKIGTKEPNEKWFPSNKCEDGNTISKLESLLQEKEERIQWEMYRADELNRQLDSAMLSIGVLENELKDSKEATEVLANRLQLTEASFAAAQETAASAQATVKQLRLETEDIALQQRQSFSEIQEATTAWQLQELQLRSQLEDAQNMIMELSMQKEPVSQSAENEPKPAAAETIMQLQVEIEALDCLIQEERSYRKEAEDRSISLNMQLEASEENSNWLKTQINESEARIERLSKEFEESEEKELEMSKKLLESAEDLNHHNLVIESLENQALMSISEINNLQTQNIKLVEALKNREDELKVVTGCVVFLQSELQRELEIRVLEMEASAVKPDSNLKEKLERTRNALEQAEQLNSKLQNEQNSLKVLEHEKELVRADAEMETTEAITLLQSELISLCEDHKISQERESKAEQKVTQLKMDVVALQARVKALSEANIHLTNLYQNALKEKDAEISKLTQEWEMAASNLIECLSEGNQALDAAAQEMDVISEECPMQGNVDTSVESPTSCKAKNLVEVLERRLLHAQKLAKQTEDKVRSLSDASLAIAEMQRQERTNMHNDLEALNVLLIEKSHHISRQHALVQNLKGRAEKGEKMFLAACSIINRLSETSSELASTNQRLQDSVNKTASSSEQKETKIQCLQLQRRTDQALLEEREAVILNNEQLIDNLSAEMQGLICQKKIVEDNHVSLKNEQEVVKAKFDMAEKQIQKLTSQVVTTEQTCVMLLGELHLAKAYMDDNIVRVFEVQVLEDLLSCQEKLVEEKLLQSSKVEAQYQGCIKDMHDRVCLLEARNEALLVDLINERDLSVQLRKDVQDSTFKLSTDSKKLEKEFLAEQGRLRQQHQESCLKVDNLENQNALLVDELNQRNFDAAEFDARLQNLLSESCARLLAVMESWSKDKISAIVEAEILKCQVCLMSEDHSLCESRQQSIEKHCHGQITCLKRESLALTQKITETNVVVQELKDELESSALQLQMSQLQAAQAEQAEAYLSIYLKNISEERGADNFATTVQMDIIKCVLDDQIQLLQDRWVTLMLEVMETRKMSAQLTRGNSHILAKMEGFISEIASLKVQNIAAEDALASLTEELSHNHEQLQLLKTHTEQAEVRCDHLVSHSSCIEEKFSLDIFVLVLEEAILKEMLVSQEGIVENEANAFRRHMQEKVDSLTSENGGLVNQVKYVLEVAQHCVLESKGLIAELKNYREQIFETEVEGSARNGIIVYKLQAMGHDGEPETVWVQNRENGLSIEQRIEHAFKALLAMTEDLKNCRFEVDALIKERNQLSCMKEHEEHLYAALSLELENSHCELKKMQLAFLEVDECGMHSIGLSKTYAKVVTEARSIATQLKEEHGLLLEKMHQDGNAILLLQLQLQQTSDNLLNLENIHSSCEGNFHQILEQEREKNEEELIRKEISECHLQSQLSHASGLAETFDQMYKDASNQLHSRNLEIERLQQQHQHSLKLISSLQQEKEILQEELTTRMSKMMSNNMRYQSAPTDISRGFQHEEALTSPKDLPFDVEKLKLSNQELKAEVERQRRDMECLQHELQKSCDIVSEVKHTHSKTLEVLHESEQQLAKLTIELEAKCASTSVLEKDVLLLQKQNVVLQQENQKLKVQHQKLEEDLSLIRLVQKKVVKSIDAVENQEIKLLALHHDFDCLLASNFTEGKTIGLVRAFDDCELMLDNIQTLVDLCSKVTKELEISQAYSKNMELALENQIIQMKSMSDKIVDLERDKEHLQEEKSRREAAIKILQLRSQQQENVQDVLKASFEESEKLLEVVEGNEMKLTGLQRKIQTMTEWLSQEIGNDFKVAFTEGCELVLNEVEKEVQTCREQAEIAWRKIDAVSDEKRQIEENLLERDQTIKSLHTELGVLQGHVGLAKQGLDGMENLHVTIRKLQGKLDDKQLYIEKLEDEFSNFQQSSMSASARLVEMEAELSELKACLSSVEMNNVQLRSELHELIDRREVDEVELADKQHAIHVLEMQLLNLNPFIEQQKAFSLDHINHDRNKDLKERDLAIKERDELHADLVVLNEQLEMAQQLAEEHEAIAVEARQIAETSKTRAEQKEEEVKFLERSVEELESTVNALETQVGLVKSDTERQRLMREDTEMELQALRHQMSLMQARQVETGCDWEQIQRDFEMKSVQLMKAEGKIQILEKQCNEKNEQIRKYKKDIVEIMSEAEKQASDHHQIIRTLENLAEVRPIAQVTSNSKLADRTAAKPRASGSPFKCIGSGLSHQMNYEIDEELSCNRQKIEELEALANSRQKEIFMLNVRLAEAESMTHDVIRDLVGVKLDITNYATVMNHQQMQKTAAKSVVQNEQSREKDKELTHLKTQLNEFIEERESWLEEINRRQAEMMTARVAAEKLRQRDQLLSTENESLKMENANQRNRIFELEEEVNKLSGQQNLQQRIHHHAKIKEENNQLRMKNEDLATKLRRSEVLLLRVGEELARYREAEGKTPYIDVEEEQRLRVKLQEVEEDKIQIAQELLTLCTSVLQVAGLSSSRGIDHTVAAEALKHLQDRLDTAEREVSDMKLKNKIESEKRHLSELRSLHSPMTTTNFAASQQCGSPEMIFTP